MNFQSLCTGTYIFVNGPVKDVIVLESLSNKEIAEDFSEVRVIRLIIKPQASSVIQVNGKLVGKATAKHLGRCSHFFLHDAVILLLLSSRFESLPW